MINRSVVRGTAIPNYSIANRSNSMSIYSSEKALPYVYICTHNITGDFYIGYREANIKPSHLDLPEYKTSSTKVHSNFQNYNWTIVAEFFDGESAYDFEQELIHINWGNPNLLNENCHYGKSRFKTNLKGVPKSDAHVEKLKIARRARLPPTDKTKYKIAIGNTGKIVPLEARQRIAKAKIGDKNPMFGKTVSNATKEKKRQSNIKYLQKLKDQGIKHPSIGFTQTRVSCLHCKKEIAVNIFSRFHKNCNKENNA